MKKIFFVLLPLMVLLGTVESKAQVSVSVNIGVPPAWGPYGYDDARFYYIPDIDIYYDVWYGNYWYFDRGVWVSAVVLPPRYARFDLYGCYKVVLDYRGDTPYRYYHDHRSRYANYRNYHGPRQQTYKDRGGYKGKGHGPKHYDQARPGQNRGGGNVGPKGNGGRNQGNQNVAPSRGGGGQYKGNSAPRQQQARPQSKPQTQPQRGGNTRPSAQPAKRGGGGNKDH